MKSGDVRYISPDYWDEPSDVPDPGTVTAMEALGVIVLRGGDGEWYYGNPDGIPTEKNEANYSRGILYPIDEKNLFESAREALLSKAEHEEHYGKQCIEMGRKLRALAEAFK